MVYFKCWQLEAVTVFVCVRTFRILVGDGDVLTCCASYSFGDNSLSNIIIIHAGWSQSLIAIYGRGDHHTVHLEGRKNSHYISLSL